MAERAKKISELDAHTNAPADNLLAIVYQPGQANVGTRKITLSNLFANVSTNVVITGARLNLPSTAGPTTSTSTGTAGEIRYDDTFIYICIANNTWRRTQTFTW